MKRYIKANSTKEVLHYRFDIYVEFQMNIDNADVAASRIYGFDPNILPEAVWTKPVAKYDGFVESVRLLLKSRGFHEIEEPYKSDSGTEYFMFCLESDYVIYEVEICCMMRLSDHQLNQRYKDKYPEDAQEDWANNYRSKDKLKYNKRAQEQRFEYDYYKYVTEHDKHQDYNVPEPNDIVITLANIVINNLKYMSTAQAMTAIDMELSDIKKELIERTNALKHIRSEYSAKPDTWID